MRNRRRETLASFRNNRIGLRVGWGGVGGAHFNRYSLVSKCQRATAFRCSWVRPVAGKSERCSEGSRMGIIF